MQHIFIMILAVLSGATTLCGLLQLCAYALDDYEIRASVSLLYVVGASIFTACLIMLNFAMVPL